MCGDFVEASVLGSGKGILMLLLVIKLGLKEAHLVLEVDVGGLETIIHFAVGCLDGNVDVFMSTLNRTFQIFGGGVCRFGRHGE